MIIFCYPGETSWRVEQREGTSVRRETLDDQLTPRTLRLIVAIKKYGHLSRAAEEVHIVPSAASRRIQKLEDVLGAPVLNRQTTGLTLTGIGLAIAEHASWRAGELDALTTEIDRLKTKSRIDLRLAASGPVLFGQLPEQLRAYVETNPDVGLSVVEQTSGAIAQGLLSGAFDMGLVLGTCAYPSLQLSLYRADRLGVVLPAGHRLDGRAVLHLADLVDDPLIIPRDSMISNLVNAMAQQDGVHLRHGINVGDFASICRLIEGGLGITVTPVGTSAAEIAKRGLACIPLDHDWARCDIHLAVRGGTDLLPGLSGLRSALLQ